MCVCKHFDNILALLALVNLLKLVRTWQINDRVNIKHCSVYSYVIHTDCWFYKVLYCTVVVNNLRGFNHLSKYIYKIFHSFLWRWNFDLIKLKKQKTKIQRSDRINTQYTKKNEDNDRKIVSSVTGDCIFPSTGKFCCLYTYRIIFLHIK